MQPFDVAVITASDEMFTHQVWAYNTMEAERAIRIFYKHSTLVGIVFGANDEECI